MKLRMANGMTKRVKADGKRIKQLRSDLAKTQRQLTDGIGVTTRTLQRAERGERISLVYLQSIAGALGVTVDEITANGGDRGDPQRINIRLNPLDPPTASKLLKFLEDGVNRIEIEFAVDPDEKLGEWLAEIIELCEELRERAFNEPVGPDGELTPSTKIRKIGRLNTLLRELGVQEVGVYLSTYTEWHVGSTQLSSPDGPVDFNYPFVVKSLVIGFSSRDAERLTRNVPRISRDGCVRIAFESNLRMRVHPNLIDWEWWFGTDIGPGLYEKYTEAYDELPPSEDPFLNE